ncbi:MAG TPA: hypothetical protein VHT94_14970 [Streptosporangiaceae bacterium]|nr:hypothetical protein [Streptosporangiaceae bacterium]
MSARGDRQWNDDRYPDDDDEELPPWAGLAVDPRWAQGATRGKRHAPVRPDSGRGAPAGYADPADPAGRGAAGGHARDGYGAPAGYDEAGTPAGYDEPARYDEPAGFDEEPGEFPPPPVRPRGRQAAARARRNRRSIYLWGGVLAVAVLVGVGVWFLVSGGSKPAAAPDPLVTTFLPGEFKTVPNACTAVTASTLNQYLPGKRVVATPNSLDGGEASLCSWTLDHRPVYRLLNVQVQAYTPNGLASGDGSATFAAMDGYAAALQQKTSPPKATHLPKATITTISGLGTKAFSALQVTRSPGIKTDLMTVVIRDRNVVLTVVLQGNSGRGGYGAVSPAQLRAGAIAAARDVIAQLK